MKTDDCIPTQTPPKPSEKAVSESDKILGKSGAEAKIFMAFVTSEKAEIAYKNGAYFMRFFIIPLITEKMEIKEIIPIQLPPAFFTDAIKL